MSYLFIYYELPTYELRSSYVGQGWDCQHDAAWPMGGSLPWMVAFNTAGPFFVVQDGLQGEWTALDPFDTFSSDSSIEAFSAWVTY